MIPRISLKPSVDNYAVMGNPIAHSKSPLIHQAFAEQLGQAIYYQAILVEPDGFEAALAEFQALGGKGLNITVPFKEDAWRAVDVLSPAAEKAGAVNTIWFENDQRCGENTDGIGLVNDLSHHEIDIGEKKVLLLGAGGAVRGILGPVLERRPAAVLIANRTPARAEALVRIFPEYPHLDFSDFSGLAGRDGFDIVINGTSAGLTGDLPALPENILLKDGCAYDLVYGDKDTPFVAWAKQRGARLVLDGLGMLVEQAAESFTLWRGVRPETRPVIEMLRGMAGGQ